MLPRPRIAVLVPILLAALALTGCEDLPPQPGTSPPASGAPDSGGTSGGDPGSGQRPRGDVAAAKADLGGLPEARERSMRGYSRDHFPHWTAQGDGCDTRDVVLKRDGSGVQATGECKITTGTWYSPYDDKTFTEPLKLDIDHMVPLAAAWRSGADKWTDEKRSEFANDLTRPQLFAVSASSNRSKGDQDPSQWQPTNRKFWCEYAADWITVKKYWQLTVTGPEKAKLGEMLATCG